MLRDFSDFYFEFEDKVSKGEYSEENINKIFKESYYKYLTEKVNIEIPKEDSEGFCFYVKLLNTEMYPRKKYKLLVKKVSSLVSANLTYTGENDPIRYWVGPFETQKEAVMVQRKLTSGGIKAKVEKWTPKNIQDALLKEEKNAKEKVNNVTNVEKNPPQQSISDNAS